MFSSFCDPELLYRYNSFRTIYEKNDFVPESWNPLETRQFWPDEILPEHVQRVDVVSLSFDEFPDAIVPLLFRLKIGQKFVPEFLLSLTRAAAASSI